MALNGTIYGSFAVRTDYSRPIIEWRASQNVAGNYSDVTAILYFRRYKQYYKSYNSQGHSVAITINGNSGTASRTFDLRNSTKYEVWRRTVRVNHNSDGTKSLKIAASGNTGVSLGSYNFSKTVTLNSIPRGSTLSAFSFASSLQIGTKNTINYTVKRHNSNFRHQIQLRDGSVTVATWDNVSSNGSSTLELTGSQVDTLLGRMSTVTSKSFTLRVATRSGVNGGWIGSAVTRNASVSVNGNVKPVIDSTSAKPIGNSWAVNKGFYVQGQTGVQAEFSSSARGGAGVKSRSISIGSLSSGGSVVGSVFRHSQPRVNSKGNITITYTITDTRGRTASDERTVNFRAYTPPQITSFSVGRSSPTSSTVTIKSQGSIHGMGGQNTGTMTITQQGVTGNVRSRSLNNTTPSFNDSFDREVAASDSVDFTITVTDSLGNSATSNSTVGTAFMEFSIRKGKGVGIGKVHEHGVLDVDGKARFGHSNFNVEGQVPVIIEMNQSSRYTGLMQGIAPDGSVVWQIGNRGVNTRSLYLEANSRIRMVSNRIEDSNGNQLVESGSNANGEWVKFYDGTLICTVTDLRVERSSSLELSGIWTLPHKFADANYTLSGFKGSAAPNEYRGYGLNYDKASTTSVGIFLSLSNGIDARGGWNTTLRLTAIGRWK